MRKNTIFCLLAAALLVFSSIGTTFAAQKVMDESVQVVNTAGVKAQIVEEYERAFNVHPGSTIPKVVNVQNTGSSDAVVRVRVEKAWGETHGEDGKLIADAAWSTDNITIEYNTEYWYYDAADGYFYYKGVLKPGETTLKPLFKEFSIDKGTGNEYMGLEADIIVKMECVQAAGNGISIWGKSFTDLGIDYIPEKPADIVTSVTFTGGDGEFVFDPENTDLFANFKNLLPGETLTQIIEVKNTFGTETGVEIFLRAEDIAQSLSTPETRILVEKLLREYATIIVTDEDGNVIYNGPIWGEPYSDAENPDSMRYDISLGIFAAGESKKLTVTLQLDPAMGNEYQELWGLIKWVWTAEPGHSSDTVVISGAKTWKHGTNPVSERPTELIIYVKANGNIITTTTVTAEDHWKWEFELPKYDVHGNEMEYTIDEEPLPGYTTTVNGSDVTNTHESYKEVVISGTKTWEHGSNTSKRPENIVVYVRIGDEVVAAKRVTANDNWQWSFTLPKYDANGNVAKYTIDEENVENYTLAKTDGYNLYNKFVNYDYPGDSGSKTNDSKTSGPKTGDIANMLLWSSLTAASALAFVILLVRGRKSKRKETSNTV